MKKVIGQALESAKYRLQKTLEEQKESFKRIREGRPMDAEGDAVRKIAFVQKQIGGVSIEIAKKISEYQPVEAMSLNKEKKNKAESLQGSTIDFMNIYFLDLGKAASRSIARIVFPNGSPEGTGFMVSPDLFLTNHHVINSKEDAAQFELEFNYEKDYRRTPVVNTRFRLNPEAFFVTSERDDLDFTLVAIGDKISGPLTLDDFGFLPIINTIDKHIKGIFVNCIQHPDGNYKQLVIRENHLLARTDNTLIYSSDTLPGASGSPLFNDDWEVIALHHWGEPYSAVVDQPEGLPKNGNEGIRISSIINHLNSLAPLSDQKAALLEKALNPGFREPSKIHLIKEGETLTEIQNTSASKTVNMEKKEALNTTDVQNINADGTVNITLPLIISVKLGLPQTPGITQKSIVSTIEEADELETAEEAAAFKFIPDKNYSNRKGYSRSFLGLNVDMPKLNDAQKQIAAKNNRAKVGDDLFELKYQHFSVVMNGKRKLAFFTAANIDGASVITIVRKTGEVKKGPEGRENWYDDPRIDDDLVCHDDLYLEPEMKIFQRGHLVKRTDPSWGSKSKAFKGQADTFHFSNCSPQHFQFNPIKSRWAGVEDWITNTSDDDNIRVTVFCGPVFRNTDQAIAGLKIPKEFWKVIIWNENGILRATGILADQSDLLGDLSEAIKAENLVQLPDKLPEEYHVRISHIQQLTNLDFGNISDFDTFGQQEGLGDKRKIESFQDLFPKHNL